jgi:nucleotide-binding universal stress UspA family protein
MSSFAQTLPVPTLKKILYATDFSPNSLAVVPYLRLIAERYASSIHVVHVLGPEPMLELPLDLPPELDADLTSAKSELKAVLGKKPFGDAAYTSTVERGYLWKVLAAIIEEEHIDLIAIGTHGRRGLKKLLVGSVAEQVFRLSPCPVLTVGPQCVKDETEPVSLGTILFATDFSPGAQRAFEYALLLAQTNHSKLILLHAVPAAAEIVPNGYNVSPVTVEVSREYVTDSLAYAREQIEELMSHETMRELNPRVIVECGGAAMKILEAAKSEHANLIVMGAHRSTGGSIASHLPWATASSVVCHAHCPVLTVRS